MKKEEIIHAVSGRTGIMPEVTEIVIDTSVEVVSEQVLDCAKPVAAAAGALVLAGVILRRLRRRNEHD